MVRPAWRPARLRGIFDCPDAPATVPFHCARILFLLVRGSIAVRPNGTIYGCNSFDTALYADEDDVRVMPRSYIQFCPWYKRIQIVKHEVVSYKLQRLVVMRSLLSLFCAASALCGAYAAIYTDPSQLPDRQYDYVVVGGTHSSRLHYPPWYSLPFDLFQLVLAGVSSPEDSQRILPQTC